MQDTVDCLRPDGRHRRLARAIVFVLVFALTTAAVESKRLPRWHSVNPQPTGEELRGMATDGESVVIVGGNGTLLHRGPGATAFRRVEAPAGSTAYLTGVAWGGDRWVAVGLLGEILFSFDGKQWDVAVAADSTDLTNVHYAKGRFVAVGAGGRILVSETGTSWRDRSVDGITADLLGITSGPDEVVAVGRGGTILASADGENFTPASSSTTADLYDVAYGNGQYLAVGRDYDAGTGLILSATSPWAWSVILTGIIYYLVSIAFGNGVFVLGGHDGAICRTTDGTGLVFVMYAAFAIAAMFFLLNLFWAIGGYGMIMNSATGVLWSVLTVYFTLFTFFAFLRFGALLMAMGGGRTVHVSSNNGQNWNTTAIGGIGATVPLVAAALLLGLVLPQVSSAGDLRPTDTRNSEPPRDWAIALAEDGTVVRTADGLTWDVFPRSGAAPPPLSGMAWGNDLIVNVGAGGHIETMDPRDLTTAVGRLSPTDRDLHSVVFTGTHFVAVGDEGTILVSPDGVAWSKKAEGAPGSGAYFVVTFDGTGRAVAAGTDGMFATGLVADAFETWSPSVIPGTGDIIAAGSDGAGTTMLGSQWAVLFVSKAGSVFDLVGVLPWQTPMDIFYDAATDAWYVVGESGMIQRYLLTPRLTTVESHPFDRLYVEWEPEADDVVVEYRSDPSSATWGDIPGPHSGFGAFVPADETASREFRIAIEPPF